MKLETDLSNHEQWLNDYFDRFQKEQFKLSVRDNLISFYKLCLSIKEAGNTMFFAGNGASAAIASHAAVDFTKQAKLTSFTFNDADLITCFANDYGYENWIAKCLEHYAKKGDVVVLISCSGKSANVVNAARYAKKNDIKVVTFTGFSENNPLKSIGDINFWVNSKAYNVAEGIHMIWITTVIDMLIGEAEYSA